MIEITKKDQFYNAKYENISGFGKTREQAFEDLAYNLGLHIKNINKKLSVLIDLFNNI